MFRAFAQRKPAAPAELAAGLRTPMAAGLLGGLAVALVVLGLRWFGAMQSLELAAYDRMVAWRGSETSPTDEAVASRTIEIAADERDITRFGWPLPDGVLADIVLRLHASEPRAIGIDIFRPTPIAPGTEQLDAALRAVPELVWADRFGAESWDALAAPAAAGRRAGFADVVLDQAGIARRQILVLGDGRRTEASLPLRLALRWLRADGIAARVDEQGVYWIGPTRLARLDGDVGGYAGLDTSGYQILLEYRAPRAVAHYSVADLIDGRVPADAIAGRVVLVGMVSDSVKDSVIAPVGTGAPVSLSGVTLQAYATAQLIAHGHDGLVATHAIPAWAETVLLVAVMAGGAAIAVASSSLTWIVVLALGGAAMLACVACWVFLFALWLPGALMVLGWLLAIGVAKTAMAQSEATQRAMLMRLFSTHMSAPIAREVWQRRGDFVRFGRPLPVRLDATVLFSDVNDFTTVAETMEPEAIVRWLEPYMIAMTDLIDAHGGCVEHFSGDGILAMFGVPMRRTRAAEIAADARAAVACALAMQGAIVRLNDEYRQSGQPEIRFAVGIQSGVLVGCSLGSRARQQYTTLGDTTNTAARLVGVAKAVMRSVGADLHACTVLGSATRDLVGDAFPLHPLGPVDLKGKARRTECFAVGLPKTEGEGRDGVCKRAEIRLSAASLE